MKILFKYTSRSRPENFDRGLLSIIENANQKDSIIFLISIDEDDPDRQKYIGICEKYLMNKFKSSLLCTGKSESKVHAINRDMNTVIVNSEGANTGASSDWDLLINMSDDMVFTEKGFDDKIRAIFASHFPLGDGFLHLNDGHQGDNVCTMSIMDRKYYDRDKYIYHPEYKSLWCDAEATEVAWMRGRYAYAPIVLFDHLHPAWGLAPTDLQYQASEAREMWNHDKAVIERHRANNYGIENPVNGFKYQTL